MILHKQIKPSTFPLKGEIFFLLVAFRSHRRPSGRRRPPFPPMVHSVSLRVESAEGNAPQPTQAPHEEDTDPQKQTAKKK